MQNVLNGVSMALGVMEKALYSSYTPAGTWIDADGKAHYLGREDLVVEVAKEWVSPHGGSYPAQWDIRVPRHDLSIAVTPVLANQELVTTVRYWEGPVDVLGTRDDAQLGGRGYVELTGYAR